MPFTNITAKHFDSGDYPEALRRAVDAIDVPAVRARQAAGDRTAGGSASALSIFCEQGAHGTTVYAGWGIPMVPGFEQATARLTPDGGLELRVGVQSHGQGLETTLAQIANEMLGIRPERIRVVHGDTALTPYSTGTWGSRCMVMAGGAVAAACRHPGGAHRRIAAHLLQCQPGRRGWRTAAASAPAGRGGIGEVARLWYRTPQHLPPDVDPAGWRSTSGYKPAARHRHVHLRLRTPSSCRVDTGTGDVAILDYAVVRGRRHAGQPDDRGRPGDRRRGAGDRHRAVRGDGVRRRGAAAGHHAAPTTCCRARPRCRRCGSSTCRRPRRYTLFGQKGIGESGAIGPPAAIANAVNDALRPLRRRGDTRCRSTPRAHPARALDAAPA